MLNVERSIPFRSLSRITARPNFAAFDLETQGLGGPVSGGSYCIEGGEPEFVGGDAISIVSEICNQFEAYPDCRWYAHNMQYDLRYFIDEFDLREYRYEFFMRTDNDVFMIIIYLGDHEISLVDSMAFFPRSLSDLTTAFAPGKEKGYIDFEKENFDQTNPDHVAYAKRDVEGLVVAMVNLDRKLLDTFQCHAGLTTASTAIKAWRHTLPKGDSFFNDDENEEFIRSSYFGGLVFLTSTAKFGACKTFDINSSYPFVMRDRGVPYGAAAKVSHYVANQPGIYHLRVRTPWNLRIPILPKRDGKFVRWPSGEFDTCVTQLEINFALSKGYKIIEVYEGLVWSETIFPFDAFVTKAENLRKEFRRKPEEDLAKLMQNSAYGKFAMRRERRKIFKPQSDFECLGATPWSIDSRFWVRVEEAERVACLPQWSVFITAAARIKLLSAAYAVGVENVIYGDTDSLTVHGSAIEKFAAYAGDEYGEWKVAHDWREFRARAPKVYSGFDLIKNKWLGAAKGMPKKHMTSEDWLSLYSGDRVAKEYDSIPKFIQTLGRGKAGQYTTTRRSSLLTNSNSWREVGESVLPIHIGTIEIEDSENENAVAV